MRISINDIKQKKNHAEKISVVTAYDYTTAKICDSSNIDIILVGDSAGMVMLGYNSTIPVTMDDMLVFCKGVVNGSKGSLVVADMPFGSYQTDITLALSNAIKFIKLGCGAVKIEGGREIASVIQEFTKKGIPVMAHIGLKPQTVPLWQGYRVQGKTSTSAIDLLNDALQIEKSGAFSIVLEMITAEVAEKISRKLSIPTIGIGSGSNCDGQVLVLHDLLGLYDDIRPKFVKRYLDSYSLFSDAIKNYVHDIKTRSFPDVAHTFYMTKEELQKFESCIYSLKNDTTDG